jgi:DNA-binding LytR/AlgR family response regulator
MDSISSRGSQLMEAAAAAPEEVDAEAPAPPASEGRRRGRPRGAGRSPGEPAIAAEHLDALGNGKLVLRATGRFILVNEADIAWLDAAGNYVRFHVGPDVHVVLGTLAGAEKILQKPTFVRIQRSTILNLDAVQEFVRGAYGDYVAVLADGTRLTVGRSYRKTVSALLKSL